VKPEPLLNFVVALCATLSLLTWLRWVVRLWRGEPLVPAERHRRVPWRGMDLAVVVAFYIAAQSVCVGAAFAWTNARDENPLETTTVAFQAETATTPAESPAIAPTPTPSTGAPIATEGPDTSHPIVQLLRQRHNRGTLLLVLLAGVLVAPLFEEFLFRVLVQGWLASRERILARTFSLVRDLPPGALAITITSFVFALLHARSGDDSPLSADELLALLAGNAAANLICLTFAIVWLVRNCHVGPRDLGLDLGHVGTDLYLGVSGFAAVLAPAYGLQIVLLHYLPNLAVATDPIPLFFFGLLVGYLYYRTGRILPAVTAHICFNGLGFLLISLQTGT